MKHFIFLFFLIASSSMAHAMSLQEYVSKKIIILNRPLLTFHYRSNIEPNNVEEVVKLAEEPTTWFYNVNVTHDNNLAGPGLYVAVDPAVSRGYSGYQSGGYR